MRQVITDDIGQVKVGDVILPGVMESLEVEGRLRVDEIEVPGRSGRSKQPQGFEDAVVTLRLRLLTDDESTCYDKCARIVKLFQSTDRYARPFVCRLVNRHTALWGIREVLFKELRTAEDNRDDTVRVEIVFEEYRPVVVRAEEAAPAPPKLGPGMGDLRLAEARSAAQPAGTEKWSLRDKVRELKERRLHAALDDDLPKVM